MWYELSHPEAIKASYAKEFSSYQKAIGFSSHILIFSTIQVLAGLVVGFINGWKYAGLLLLSLPLMLWGLAGYSKSVVNSAQKIKMSSKKAGLICQETFETIKTVQSLNGEEHELGKYTEEIKFIKRISLKYNKVASVFYGILHSSIVFEYAFSWLFGAIFMRSDLRNDNFDRSYRMRDIYVIFYAVVHGSFALGSIGPNLEAVIKGKEAAKRLFDVIDTLPTIQVQNDPNKHSAANICGEIEFRNVVFSYPSSKDKKVLKGISFKIKAG